MKLFLLLLSMAIYNCQNNEDSDWFQFKQNHNKFYTSPEEENSKFGIWQLNKDLIEQHNKQFELGLVSYTLRMNEFGDLTAKQFTTSLTGFDLGLMRKLFKSSKSFSFNGSIHTPIEIDWVAQGRVTGVKNQGSCGCCFAFSAIGAIEGLNHKVNNELLEFSAQELLDCSNGVYGNLGCDGGLMTNSFNYIMQNGISLLNNYKYVGSKKKCNKKIAPKFMIKHYMNIDSNDEDALTQAVALNGPISVGIDASKSTFQFYNSGVYYDPTCSSTDLDHAVLVVGYGSDFSGTIPKDYYRVKNSWGHSWGEEGYIRMSRNRNNSCGISTIASFPTL